MKMKTEEVLKVRKRFRRRLSTLEGRESNREPAVAVVGPLPVVALLQAPCLKEAWEMVRIGKNEGA